jgi:hypothetical protein
MIPSRNFELEGGAVQELVKVARHQIRCALARVRTRSLGASPWRLRFPAAGPPMRSRLAT